MILKTAFICKILTVVVIWVASWFFFRGRLRLRYRLFFSFAVLFFALIANTLSTKIVVPLKDTLTINAVGEKNDMAQADEIFIKGFLIDGISYKPENAIEGKWFWIGENYVWRNESDHRQPEGTTRTITLAIPVGRYRQIEFVSDNWRGLAEIDDHNSKQLIDTFLQSEVKISRSSFQVLILNQIRLLLTYAIILMILSMSLGLGILFGVKNHKQVKIWVTRNDCRILYAVFALFSLGFMLAYAGKTSFWLDELSQITFSGVKQTLSAAILEDLHAPPLYTTILFFWYRLVPYGESWLLFPTEIAMAVAVFMTGLLGERVFSRRVGCIAAFLTAVNFSALTGCGMELRAYSFLLLFSTILLYDYIGKLKAGIPTRWHLIRIGIWMALCAYSHYFGVVFSGTLFLIDIGLWAKKKIRLDHMFSYVTALFLYLPWLYVIHDYSGTGEWQPVPDSDYVISLLKFLSGDTTIVYYLFCIGVIILLTKFFLFSVRKTYSFPEDFVQTVLLWLMIIMIGSVYIYGKYIGIRSTFWVDRYFFSLLPCALLISAYAVDVVCNSLLPPEKQQEMPVQLIACICLGLFLVGNTNTRLQAHSQDPYREAVEWLYTQGNTIYNEDTLVLCGDGIWFVAGLEEYYALKQGTRDRINIISQKRISQEQLLSYNRIYTLVMDWRSKLTIEKQTFLFENYQLEQRYKEIGVESYIRRK